MGIQSVIGDVKSTVGQNISYFLDEAWSAVNGVTSGIGTFTANIWDGGFAGVSDFDALKSAIEKYAQNVSDIVDEYNVDADLGNTFKGAAATSLSEFIASTKELLKAYVQLVNLWKTELDDAYTKYNEGDTNLNTDVTSDSDDVKNAAKNVQIG